MKYIAMSVAAVIVIAVAFFASSLLGNHAKAYALSFVPVLLKINDAGWDCRDQGKSKEECRAAMYDRLVKQVH